MIKRKIFKYFGVTALIFVIIAVASIFIKYSFYRIPSEPMVPTAHIGDFIAVNKFAKDPKPGDLIVILVPQDNNRTYLKRLIGMPGDRIQMIKGVLHINGESVKLEAGDVYEYDDQKGNPRKGITFLETLPNGVRYRILKLIEWGASHFDNIPEIVVPAGKYFILGDNRDQSLDSRSNNIGCVDISNLIGSVDYISNNR